MAHSKEWYKKWKHPRIRHGKPTRWGWIVLYPEKLKLGFGVDVGAFTLIHAGADVEIEDHVQIGSHCAIYSVDSIGNRKGKVVLKKGCKIGTNSVVLPRVTVGENSIIGAFSLVNRDVPKNEVWVGVPVRRLKGRLIDKGL